MQQLTISPENYQKIVDVFVGLVESMKRDVGVPLDSMLNSEVGERFMLAPASNRANYHNCFPGGLVEHSLRVYMNLQKLSKLFAPDINEDSLKLVGLFHDLGKVGTVTEPYYIEVEEDWKRDRGIFYDHNQELVFMDAAQRTLFLLSHFGVPIGEEEWQAILIHDGQYIEANKRYGHKETTLALLLHQADMIAAKTEKEKWNKLNGISQ